MSARRRMIPWRPVSSLPPAAPPEAPPQQPPARPPRTAWRPQFGLWGLLATMGLLSIPLAVWGGLLREVKKSEDGSGLMFFVLLAIASPVLVMVLIAAVRPLAQWREARRRRE